MRIVKNIIRWAAVYPGAMMGASFSYLFIILLVFFSFTLLNGFSPGGVLFTAFSSCGFTNSFITVGTQIAPIKKTKIFTIILCPLAFLSLLLLDYIVIILVESILSPGMIKDVLYDCSPLRSTFLIVVHVICSIIGCIMGIIDDSSDMW